VYSVCVLYILYTVMYMFPLTSVELACASSSAAGPMYINMLHILGYKLSIRSELRLRKIKQDILPRGRILYIVYRIDARLDISLTSLFMPAKKFLRRSLTGTIGSRLPGLCQ
jgi:hypothetical protein